MHTSYLQQHYAAQTVKENGVTKTSTQARTIQTVIDPRFDALINRATTSTRLNRISPEIRNDTSSPNLDSTAHLDPTSQSVSKKQLLSPICKSRLQGLLIGFLAAAIIVAIILAVLLTRSSSSSTSSTSTSTASSCDTLQWNPIGVTIIGNGSTGNSFSQLNSPSGVYVDANDIIYIADTKNHRILRVSSDSNGIINVSVVAGKTGVSTLSSETLNGPRAVYVDSQENLYILDSNNCRVQFWPYGALNGSTVAGSSTGVAGSTLDKLSTSYSFYVDQANNIYVSDAGNARAVKWTPGASAGILVAGNGSAGYSSSQLQLPIGITVDSQSNILYIADYSAYTINAWPFGATVGTVVAGMNSTLGNIPSLLFAPWGIVRDVYGNLYVADAGNHRIQMFCAVGSSFSTGKTIAGIGVSYLSSRGLNLPTGIAFDSQMNLYVADYGNHRVQKFLRTN